MIYNQVVGRKMLSYFPLHDLKAYVNLLYVAKLSFNEYQGSFRLL